MQAETFDKRILQKYRQLLFPIVSEGVITGYNVYKSKPASQAPFHIHYLHSDLGIINGQPQAHLVELLDRLDRFGPSAIQEKINNSIVDRLAIYKVGDWEDNPVGLKFYDAEGNRLSKEELKTYRGLLIVEGWQYDLGIDAVSRCDLNKTLDVLNKHTFAHKIDKSGLRIKQGNSFVFNPRAIAGAWEIPLIVVSAQEVRRPDYKNIADVTMEDTAHRISTFVDVNLKTLEERLNAKQVPYTVLRKFANNAFVETYINS